MTVENPIEPPVASVGPGGILGVAIGFVILLGCLAALFFYGSKTFAAQQALEASFALGELPANYSLGDEGYLLPGGERVYVFSDATQAAEMAADTAAIEELVESGQLTAEEEEPSDEPASSEGPHGAEFEPYDWSSIEVLSTDTVPTQFFLVQYPTGRANDIIRSEFQRIDWKELKFIDADGGRTAVDGGKLEWAGYAADFVRERKFIRGGTFRDIVRVNLSVGGECWIGYFLWPTSHAGSKDAAAEVLTALRPVD